MSAARHIGVLGGVLGVALSLAGLGGSLGCGLSGEPLPIGPVNVCTSEEGCVAGRCEDPCDDVAECVPGNECSAGRCIPSDAPPVGVCTYRTW